VTAEEAVGAAVAEHAARYAAVVLVSDGPADYLAQHAGAPWIERNLKQ
jgi:hypothetical protein